MTNTRVGRRALAGAAWIAVETTFVQGLSLGLFAVIAWYVTPREFGLASICYLLINSFKIPFDSVSTVVARQPKADDIEYSTAFWITIGIAVCSLIAIQALALVVDKVFSTSGLGNVLCAMSFMLITIGLGRTQEVWLQRHFMFRTLALRSMFGATFGGGVGVILAMQGYGVWALVVQQIVTSLSSFGLLWLNCPWRPQFAFAKRTGREILNMSPSIIGNAIVYAANQNGDTLLIGLVLGPANVGLYNVGKRLRYALQLVIATPINGVAMPSLAESQEHPARFAMLFLTATSIVFALCAPAFIGAASVSPDVIVLLFGPQWAAAAPVFSWLAIGGLFAIVVDYNNNVFFIYGRPAWNLYMTLLFTGLSIPLFFLTVIFHSRLLALPFVLPYLVVVPISIALLGKVAELSWVAWARAALPPLAAAGLMYVILQHVGPLLHNMPPLVRLGALVALGATTYLFTLAAISRRLLVQLLALFQRQSTASNTEKSPVSIRRP